MISFQGAFTALITPFTSHGALDEEGLRTLIRYQIRGDIDGIVVLGSTGESPTIDDDEKKRIITIAREEIKNDTLLIVGTGCYSTANTIKNTLLAQELGADGVLVITPYYNRPTQEGLYLHFRALCQATDIPILLYNNPIRTGQNLLTDTLKRLLEIPSIVGIKETSGSIIQANEVLEAVRINRPEFSVLCGDDVLALPVMALGGHGLISVLSNLLPKEVKELINAAVRGNFEEAREIHYQLMPIIKALSVETNPIPIKAAMRLEGLPAGECRMPLCSISEKNAQALKNTLKTQLAPRHA
jgi:4-hydroxy-tetrahydrodipicolinate synthase